MSTCAHTTTVEGSNTNKYRKYKTFYSISVQIQDYKHLIIQTAA